MEKYYDVVTTEGKTYIISASSIQIKDGYIYFNNPEGSAKRMKADEVVTIDPGQKKYCTLAKVSGVVSGLYVGYWTREVFCNAAKKMCPSNNPAIKFAWGATASIAAAGLGSYAAAKSAEAMQESVQPVIDFTKVCWNFVKTFKNSADNEPPIKEVFEENSNNVTNEN